MLDQVKDFAKRSKTVHGVYKFLRDHRHVPAGRWSEVDKLWPIMRVLPNTMLPISRLFDTFDAVADIDSRRVEGDIVECGVWNGGCIGLMALAHLKSRPQTPRVFHLFDSFQGLPQPSAEDTDIVPGFTAQHPDIPLYDRGNFDPVPIGACKGETDESVRKFLTRTLQIPERILVFHTGWFQDTVPVANDISKIAILRIEGDWYDSTNVCIRNLYERVSPGGYIMISDYWAFHGSKRAVDEFYSSIEIEPDIIRSDKDAIYILKS